MVDISERLRKIGEFVNKGEYFTINRARQYGKTTTLRALKRYLQDEYIVISLDFQKLDAAKFQDGNMFSLAFASYFIGILMREYANRIGEARKQMEELREIVRSSPRTFTLFDLFGYLSQICEAAEQPIVMMIDEVDSAANYQVFLDFLAQLRGYYIDRDEMPIFQSVILAGVYDIKSLKLKMRSETERQTNSPWNIINGTGNYYIESRTRTNRRTDLIIDFCGQQKIVELKIWHGDEYNRRGEEQLSGYLDEYHLKWGYMVSVNFNKKKQVGVHKFTYGDKVLIEAVV